MANKTKSLVAWCQENGKKELLQEWDENKNSTLSIFPEKVEYNTSRPVHWKCKGGHEWIGPIIARTHFGRECPICNVNMSVLPIGAKYGCLTIIGDYSVYEKEVAEGKIAELEKKREEFLQGKGDPHVRSVDYYNHQIDSYKKQKYYQCQCTCGLTQFIDEFHFLRKKHRYCTEALNNNFISAHYPMMNECRLRTKHKKELSDSYIRIPDKNYAIDFTHTFHESLEVLECINDHHEKLTSWHDKRKKGGATYTVYKLYKCKCYLCGKEKEIDSSQFDIDPPTEYGYNAYNGYYSKAYCDCHKISSFQWIVNKILKEHNIPYRVEVSFQDLYGVGNTNLLKYDFSVLNHDGTIKCLIECQGEQHYMPVDEFGGETQFNIQKKNDELKRKYAMEHGLTLLEIPYKIKKFEKVEMFLKSNNVI